MVVSRFVGVTINAAAAETWKHSEVSPRRLRWWCPREHARDSGWQGIKKCGAGSAWVEGVLLVARLLLFKLLRGGLVSKRKLQERMTLFNAGDWAPLLHKSNKIAKAGAQVAVRKRRQHAEDDISRRAARAERLALSVSCQQLVAANARLRVGESLFAFFDDVYVTCAPESVGCSSNSSARDRDPLRHCHPPRKTHI